MQQRPFSCCRFVTLLSIIVVNTACVARTSVTNSPASAQPAFEKDIQAFEAADRKSPPPQHAILFVGSSSIRLWKTLPEDFPSITLINRGFGGSTIPDNIRYARRIITPCNPRQIVFYAGDNDLASGATPRQVLADFQSFVKTVRTDLPDVPDLPIDFIAIKPSPSRWRLADKIKQANALIQAYARQTPAVSYIDVFTPILSSDGSPREDLFLADNLHLNRKGYTLWADIIRPHLRLR
ncbi:MAG: SGNH/GDSL hydrolase family protein [Planctomycetota bacterium]|nr:SGNH/GDSL hydrolase family protein [Planctomycetota bacterium]